MRYVLQEVFRFQTHWISHLGQTIYGIHRQFPRKAKGIQLCALYEFSVHYARDAPTIEVDGTEVRNISLLC